MDGGPLPLETGAENRDPLDARRAERWILAFLLLGLAARLLRYALRFPLWEDECFLAANLLDRDYLGLMEGLDYLQVCPFLFLWIQKAAVSLLGFNEYSLRLFALLCSVASLLLFCRLARRFLQGTPLVLAVAILAVSYPGVRYAAEAKQYASDLLFSLVLLSLAVEWWMREDQSRWLWAMAAVVPLAVGISYPAVFVGGGLSLFVAFLLWNDRSRRGWTPWVVYNVALVGSFLAIFLISAEKQSAHTLEYMRTFWHDGFPPPLSQPFKLITWLIEAHTSDMLAYPTGGRHGGSVLTFLCCAVAVVWLSRRRQWEVLLFFLAPLFLTFLAAILRRYPYGQMVKLQIYLAPAFCMLAGLGAAMLLLRSQKGKPVRIVPLTVTLSVLLLFGVGLIARDFALPMKTASMMRARDFARWFWFTAQFDGEVACLKTDLGKTFSTGTFQRGLSAVYLCNQRIYSPRHARQEPLPWDRISAKRPLRCVEYRATTQDYDEKARDAWLESMKERFDLVAVESYPFVMAKWPEDPPVELDKLQVYKFVPKASLQAAMANAAGSGEK